MIIAVNKFKHTKKNKHFDNNKNKNKKIKQYKKDTQNKIKNSIRFFTEQASQSLHFKFKLFISFQ